MWGVGQHLWSFFLSFDHFFDVVKIWGGGCIWIIVSALVLFDHELSLTRTMDRDQDPSLTIKFSEKVQIFHQDQLVLRS